MPVHRRSILIIVVLHVYDKLIAPASFEEGCGKGPVEDFATGFLETVCSELQTHRTRVSTYIFSITVTREPKDGNLESLP